MGPRSDSSPRASAQPTESNALSKWWPIHGKIPGTKLEHQSGASTDQDQSCGTAARCRQRARATQVGNEHSTLAQEWLGELVGGAVALHVWEALLMGQGPVIQ